MYYRTVACPHCGDCLQGQVWKAGETVYTCFCTRLEFKKDYRKVLTDIEAEQDCRMMFKELVVGESNVNS